MLNHGSFGATPTTVLAHQRALRDRMEARPVHFFVRELEAMLDDSRAELAQFLGARAADLAFIPNATTGVNAVLASLDLERGDELLTTDQAYNACRNALDYYAAKAGATVVVAKLPWPAVSDDEVVHAITSCATSRTRLALIDHVTSATAVVLPIKRIVEELDTRGIDTLVDGAHAPGMLDFALDSIGAAYSTANCHKWLCAPKGAAYLHVRADRQGGLHPAVISHGYNAARTDRSKFHCEFDWIGTMDYTPWLCVATALREMERIGGSWSAIREQNRALCLEGLGLLQDALGGGACAPASMIGSIACVKIPDSDGPPPVSALFQDALQLRLLEDPGVEVPIIPFPAHPQRLLRISAQVYNDLSQYRALAGVLPGLVGG